jgi:hypothetical protein
VRNLPLFVLGAMAALGRYSVGVDLSAVGREQFVSRDTQRSFASMHGQMHPAALNELASKRRRAQQGKPGKRWRGGRA